MFSKTLVSLSALGAAHAFGDVYAPGSTAEAWANHFSAFGAQDVAKIGLDYDEYSVLQVASYCEKELYTYNGREEIEGFFAELFEDLYDTTTLEVHALDEYEDGVFLVWSNKGTGFTQVTDTFIFDENTQKILQQNIAAYSDTCEYADRRRTQSSVDDSWNNHFNAFGNQDLPAILEDYVEDSVVAVYNFHDDSLSYFTGLAEIEGLFTGLFADLADLNNLDAPVVLTAADPAPNTLLVWECPGCNPADEDQYNLVTDTFVYSEEQYAQNGPAIIRQNIVVFSTTQ